MRVDDREPASTDIIALDRANRSIEAVALVGHLYRQAFVLEPRVQLDRPAAIDDRVGHQFAHQQLGGLHIRGVELSTEPPHHAVLRAGVGNADRDAVIASEAASPGISAC